jgi:hypothetical protein
MCVCMSDWLREVLDLAMITGKDRFFYFMDSNNGRISNRKSTVIKIK